MARKTKTELMELFVFEQAHVKTIFFKLLRGDLKLVKLKTNNEIKLEIQRYKDVYLEVKQLIEDYENE